MWKWLGGCLLLGLVLLAAAFWWGYQSLQKSTSPDGSSVVVISAPAKRVFASLANADSVATWMAEGNTVTAPHHGPLVVGDTLKVETRQLLTNPRQRFMWRVTQVVPDSLLKLDMRSDRDGKIIATRSHLLVSMGDSTRVVSRVVSPAIDSIRTHGDTTLSRRNAALDVTSTLIVGMFQMQLQLELAKLKARIEQRPITRR